MDADLGRRWGGNGFQMFACFGKNFHAVGLPIGNVKTTFGVNGHRCRRLKLLIAVSRIGQLHTAQEDLRLFTVCEVEPCNAWQPVIIPDQNNIPACGLPVPKGIAGEVKPSAIGAEGAAARRNWRYLSASDISLRHDRKGHVWPG